MMIPFDVVVVIGLAPEIISEYMYYNFFRSADQDEFLAKMYFSQTHLLY